MRLCHIQILRMDKKNRWFIPCFMTWCSTTQHLCTHMCVQNFNRRSKRRRLKRCQVLVVQFAIFETFGNSFVFTVNKSWLHPFFRRTNRIPFQFTLISVPFFPFILFQHTVDTNYSSKLKLLTTLTKRLLVLLKSILFEPRFQIETLIAMGELEVFPSKND